MIAQGGVSGPGGHSPSRRNGRSGCISSYAMHPRPAALALKALGELKPGRLLVYNVRQDGASVLKHAPASVLAAEMHEIERHKHSSRSALACEGGMQGEEVREAVLSDHDGLVRRSSGV